MRDGEVVWADAVGARRRGAGEEATPEHQYRIGSITKTFTAVAVMQLRDAGKLDLEDRLDAHLDVPARGDLTLRRMLSHGSGLQREIPGDVWETLEFPKSTDELLATLEEAERVLAPGERWHYSNLAFILLGEVVAKLSGMPYEDYVEQRILQPLGLTRTSFSPEAPTAVAYSVEPYSDVVRREPMLVERRAASPPRASCGRPSATSAAGRRSSRIPIPTCSRPSRVELMTSVQTMADPYRWSLAWGVGLMLVRKDDRIYCGHDGGMPGYLANVLVDREDELGAAVLVNGENVEPGRALARARREDARAAIRRRPRRGARARRRLRSSRARSGAGGPRARVRLPLARRPARGALGGGAVWQPWARFEPLDGDRFRTVFGRERGELLRLVRDADGNGDADVLGDVSVQPRAGSDRHPAVDSARHWHDRVRPRRNLPPP